MKRTLLIGGILAIGILATYPELFAAYTHLTRGSTTQISDFQLTAPWSDAVVLSGMPKENCVSFLHFHKTWRRFVLREEHDTYGGCGNGAAELARLDSFPNFFKARGDSVTEKYASVSQSPSRCWEVTDPPSASAEKVWIKCYVQGSGLDASFFGDRKHADLFYSMLRNARRNPRA